MAGKTLRVGLLAAALLTTAVSSASAAGWKVVLTPPKASYASGVSCPRANLCLVTAGHRTDLQAAPGFRNAVPAIEKWNGHRWTRQLLPQPHAAKFVTLGPLSCLPGHSAHPFCMAAGTYWTKSSLKRNGSYAMAERLSGGHWSVQRLPSPGLRSFRNAVWGAISCGSKRLCVAVGRESYPATPSAPLLERYNGHRWTATRPAGTSNLTGISCPAKTFCVAVGNVITKAGELDTSFVTKPVTLTWNGTGWSPALASQDHLNANRLPNVEQLRRLGRERHLCPGGHLRVRERCRRRPELEQRDVGNVDSARSVQRLLRP
jgi:hypothetical protein